MAESGLCLDLCTKADENYRIWCPVLYTTGAYIQPLRVIALDGSGKNGFGPVSSFDGDTFLDGETFNPAENGLTKQELCLNNNNSFLFIPFEALADEDLRFYRLLARWLFNRSFLPPSFWSLSLGFHPVRCVIWKNRSPPGGFGHDDTSFSDISSCSTM